MFQSIANIAAEIRGHRRHVRILENLGVLSSAEYKQARRRLEDAEYRLIGRCNANRLNDGGYDRWFESALDRVCSE